VCILLGYNLANFRIWDGIRGIDYLLTRREVDPKRIGCTGNSGGGTLSTYISALDERVTVGVPSCYITTLPERIRSRITADDEQNFNPCFVYGIDHFDLLSLRAPRPTQINAAIQDYFPIAGARQTFRDLQEMYRVYNAVDRVNIVEADEKHGYSKPLREGTYAWMNRWLGDGSADNAEPEITIDPDYVLQCTTSGQVVESLGGETVYTINRAFYNKVRYRKTVPTNVRQFPNWCEELRAEVRRLLALPSVSGTTAMHRGEPQELEGFTQTRVVFESEPGIAVPGVLLLPRERPARVTVMVFEDGKDAHLSDDHVVNAVKSGRAVYLIDPRGVGETMSQRGDRKRYYAVYQQETELTYTSFMLGRPILGQRVFDVLRALDAVAAMGDVDSRDIAVEGQGRAALTVFFAAALDERVSAVTCHGLLVSYESLAMNKYFNHHPSSLIPGVLRSFDLPLVAALVAPRKLALEGTVDEMKEVMPPHRVREIYRPAESVYRMIGNVRGLAVQ
jgi:cephalosporin-C deacetylase-like acetyl esterase